MYFGTTFVICFSPQTALQLTEDHKPNLPSEKRRIEAANGFVHNKRVNGVLAVSRSFGDIMYKSYQENTNEDMKLRPSEQEEKEACGGLWSPIQQVISKPEVSEAYSKDTLLFVT